jgi:parallel beta-helix repeat protein
MTIPLRCPLAAAILLVFGHAGAAIIDVDIGGDAHVSGHCTLREAIASANTHAAPADTNCVPGSATGGNTIAVPPSLSPIELTGAALDIADTGGTTLIHSTVSGTQVAVRRASGSEPVFRASQPAAFEDLAISGGHGTMTGGGIAGGSTSVTVRRCLVHDNVSQYFSGGITIDHDGTLDVIDTTVSGNRSSAYGNGGGIGVNLATLTMTGSTVSDNSAVIGGGIFAWQSSVSIHNSTLSGNVASDQGGGIRVYGSVAFKLTYATIAGNAAPHGAGILIYSRPASGTVMAARNSLLWGNTGAPDIEHMGGPDDIIGGSYNLIAQVGDHISYPPNTLHCDPQLRPLAWNGGPTWTHALPANSCAVDAGGVIPSADYDQRGTGHPRWMGTQVDIGAYEYNSNDPNYDLIFANGFD